MRTNYFVATRVPARGGLVIVETNSSFRTEWKNAIQRNCIELIVNDENRSALSICPLNAEWMAVSMARRACGSRLEKREHEAIRGIVISMKEMDALAERFPDGALLEPLFFPEGSRVVEEQGQWTGIERSVLQARHEMPHTGKLSVKDMIGLHKAVKEVTKQGYHVQLAVSEEMEMQIQMLCYAAAEPEQMRKLYVISNGECTLADAHILITKEIHYQNAGKYRRMTLGEFIGFGYSIKEKKPAAKKEEEGPDVNEGVRRCLEYIQDPFVPEYTLCEVRREFLQKSRELCEEFQGKLRVELEDMEVSFLEIYPFVKILHLAYENFRGECQNKNWVILPSPYNMDGMIRSLHAKKLSRREYRKYLLEIVRVQFDNYARFIPEKIIRRAIRMGGRNDE